MEEGALSQTAQDNVTDEGKPDGAALKNKGEAIAAIDAYERARFGAGGARETSNGERGRSNRKSALIGAAFMAVVLVVTLVYIQGSGQGGELVHALGTVQAPWIVVTAAIMVLYLAFGALAFVCSVAVSPDAPAGVLDLCSVEAAGTFFGNLTPMMAGSVPGQVWRLIKAGLDLGAAGAVQLTRFIMFQLAEIVLAGVLLAATWPWFFSHFGAVMWINVALFGVKAAELVFLLLVCLFPHWVERVALKAFAFIDRHRLFGLQTRTDGWREQVRTQVGQFSTTFRSAATDVGAMAAMLVVSMVQQACLYATPWFVLKAFSIDTDFLTVMAAGSMVQFVSSSIPLPGGTGGIEASFALFFGPLFGPSATAGYLVWRLVTFYGYTALCGCSTVLRTKDSSPTVRQRLYRASRLLVRAH